MPRPSQAVTYAAVLRRPGAARAFAAASLSRLSYGTVSLSLLLTAAQATGSFGTAGSVVAAFGLPALLLPYKARLLDRHGLPPVLLPLSLGCAACLLAAAACAAAGARSPGPYLLLALAAGVLAPPVGPVMRTVWASLTPEPAARQRAYGLDAASEEALSVLGPVLVGLLAALVAAWAALVLTAALALAGSVVLATVPVRGTATAVPSPRDARGPLRLPRFRWLLLLMLAMSLALGPAEVAVVARVAELGHATSAGPVLAALSLGSAVGGLLWGRVPRTRRHVPQLLGLLSLLAVGLALAAAAPGVLALTGALALTGTVVAPLFVVAYVAADRLVPERSRTEATTWVATASNLGGAAGVAASGLLVDAVSARTTLLLAAVALALAVPVLALLAGRLTRSRDH